MDLNLKGRKALVAGSTQGIGKAVAKQLAEWECELLLVARDEKKLEETAAELIFYPDQVHQWVAADFTQPDQVKKGVADKLREFGPVHILINNTGGPPAGEAIDAQLDEFRNAFEMHLICNHILVQLTVPGMKSEGYGRIVNVISTSVKQPLPNLGVSNTIRGAVANWAKTLANELGQFNITVNNVLPGATNTSRLVGLAKKKGAKSDEEIKEVINKMGEKSPMNRVAEPEEVANAICFLASPAASYINGINLPVDGGRTGCL